jgi:predicted transcriptional regulator
MQDMKNDRLFSFRLPDADLEALEQIAIDEDRTIADIMRRAISEYLVSRAVARREFMRCADCGERHAVDYECWVQREVKAG